MLTSKQPVELDNLELQQFYEKLQTSVTLASLVLMAWQIGLWFAKTLVEQQLDERAKLPQSWGNYTGCGSRLESKGWRCIMGI